MISVLYMVCISEVGLITGHQDTVCLECYQSLTYEPTGFPGVRISNWSLDGVGHSVNFVSFTGTEEALSSTSSSPQSLKRKILGCGPDSNTY